MVYTVVSLFHEAVLKKVECRVDEGSIGGRCIFGWKII